MKKEEKWVFQDAEKWEHNILVGNNPEFRSEEMADKKRIL
jgi:hypothetical protein